MIVYLEDPRDPFVQKDRDFIAPSVLSSKISVDGRWLAFEVDLAGLCMRVIADLLAANGHHNLSIRRNPDLDNIEWEKDDGCLELGVEESIGVSELQELGETVSEDE